MNQIHRLTVLSHKTELKEGNNIGPFTSIGLPGESYGRNPSEFAQDIRPVIIGSGNIIRENITIHDGVTIGDQNMIMSHSHLGHDV
jgi:acyl-[acyl carrier protein]--UDP-N-acetylglucosamine O-acyltransferase